MCCDVEHFSREIPQGLPIKAGEVEDRKGPESMTNGPLRNELRCFETNFFLFNSGTE